MGVTLRQAEIFISVVKFGSMSKAAEQLCLTQAAASMALKEFETQIGEQLFDRRGKKLILNENGRTAVSVATGLISQAKELQDIFEDQSSLHGHLNIGASSSIGNYVLPGYVADFVQANRAASVKLQVGNTEEIIDRVLHFDVDIGIIEGLCHDPVIKVVPWMDDELVVFAAADHELAKTEDLTREDLANAAWILREEGSGTRRILQNQLDALALEIHVVLELGHTEAIKNTVAGGYGISCLSNYVLKDLVELKKIKTLKTPYLNLKRKFYVLIHRDKFRTKILKGFMKTLGCLES